MNQTDLASQTTQQQHVWRDHVMVDIITMIRDSGDGHMSQNYCISRVIHTLRDIKPDAYTPKFVSLGPFHYGNGRLKYMERQKQVFLKRFTQRSSTNLDVLVSFVKSLVPKVRASYSENINLSDKELVKLILLDAVFVIELFFSKRYDPKIFFDDAKLSLARILHQDLVLFENQLPFFVFEELFNMALPLKPRVDGITFLELAYGFFSARIGVGMPKHDLDIDNVSVKHFTDLLRFLLLQTAPPTTERLLYSSAVLLYSAKELQEFGVKFRARKSNSFLDIKFSGHVLELPGVFMADRMTEALFLNVIAFEHIHCPFTSYITSYVIVWSGLINKKEDVNVLVDNKIIRNFMADTEAVTALRIMTKNCFQGFMISKHTHIFERLNAFCENGWRQSKASLRRDYCRTPWQTVASFAGIILLILTILQTIFSILQVIKENK